MTLAFSPPTLDLIPLFRRAIREGLREPPAWLAVKYPDDRELLQALLNSGAANGRDIVERHVWLHDGRDFLGTVNLRDRLTLETERQGGHIGYAVHPRHRNKGYATMLLRRGLAYLQQDLALPRALITIDDDNGASVRVAEKCGARLQDIIEHPNKPGVMHRRYWIDLGFRIPDSASY